MRDTAAVRAACRRLSLAVPTKGKAKLFKAEADGIIVRLHDWQYPVVCDVTTGQLHYDNYKGRWGDQKHLDHFLQAYAVEKAKLEARRRGHAVTEQTLNDGSIKLVIQTAGGPA